MTIAVLVNPRSKRNQRDAHAMVRLARLVSRDGALYPTGDLAALDDAARACLSRGIDLVAISGGDGTTSVALTRFRTVYGDATLPRFALLRGGTMNTVARALGSPNGTPETLFPRLADAARRNELRGTRRTSLDVGGRLGFLFGAGAVHGFMDEYYRAGRGRPSPSTAARVLSRMMASSIVSGPLASRVIAPLDARITVDGNAWPRAKYVVLLVGTVDQVGLGFRPFRRIGEGEMSLVATHGSASLVARRLPRALFRRSMGPDCASDLSARELIIEPEDERVDHMVDGDIVSHRGTLVVRMGPEVRFVWG